MYKDPKRYGFIFQSYVQLTMLEMHDEISQSQTEQVKRFEQAKKQLEQSNSELELKPANKANALKDSTNKDQKIENSEKKRKSSQEETLSLKKAKTEVNSRPSDPVEADESKGQQPTVDYPINMMERSIFSARYIFVENLYQK